ncbi:hypothetical protein LZZ85_11265 [Terrimonas sp. NA20]|uniref:Uncharacterized protein n=1 Tax=Terrimonas ginsenosidimutans TaxID=2908004 RepID=A0ABS9KRE5_9BACT|nr:hypothetical protein [Terrimonas ginsenosidimutans]MCG2614867.1 hypothetical protein [Terrimonas ginsenosidimutans]
MVKGFEEKTQELNSVEKDTILPALLGKLCTHKGKANAISATELERYVKERGLVKSLPGNRVRKIVEYIRQSYLLEGLVACNVGYYIADTPEELLEWIVSMRQRIAAMKSSMQPAEKVYKRMTGVRQPNQHGAKEPMPGVIHESLFQ